MKGAAVGTDLSFLKNINKKFDHKEKKILK